ncbi:olfactory receptor 5AP2-like [Pleurodeles waltl]|uniref:olfactory receptor 5AP2-like n=1 Tax=Pleurodeles waltl TaxID=8319 RepID=UPI003709584F
MLQSTEGANLTSVNEFIFLGLTDDPKLCAILFVLFLIMYAITLTGNTGIPILIKIDPTLQTPMYFFLSNLSCVDLCYSSAITPKMLASFLSNTKSISFYECVAQLFCFSVCGTSECLLLAVMAYDRYVAICNPLLYPIIINRRTCMWLVSLAYCGSALNAAVQATLTFNLSFCRSNVINHFFCDMPPLLKLSCSDTSRNELVIFVISFSFGIGSCSVILISYTFIITTILSIRSKEGRKKSFSTCASHIAVVSLFYGTIFFMYLRLNSRNSVMQDKVTSIFYTVVNPMLNPLIYSLRNQDVKRALKKLAKTKLESFAW